MITQRFLGGGVEQGLQRFGLDYDNPMNWSDAVNQGYITWIAGGIRKSPGFYVNKDVVVNVGHQYQASGDKFEKHRIKYKNSDTIYYVYKYDTLHFLTSEIESFMFSDVYLSGGYTDDDNTNLDTDYKKYVKFYKYTSYSKHISINYKSKYSLTDCFTRISTEEYTYKAICPCVLYGTRFVNIEPYSKETDTQILTVNTGDIIKFYKTNTPGEIYKYSTNNYIPSMDLSRCYTISEAKSAGIVSYGSTDEVTVSNLNFVCYNLTAKKDIIISSLVNPNLVNSVFTHFDLFNNKNLSLRGSPIYMRKNDTKKIYVNKVWIGAGFDNISLIL